MADSKLEFDIIEPSRGVVDVPGFQAAGVPCDVRGKGNGQLDLALVYSEVPCVSAGVFTRNHFAAAPVQLGRAQLASRQPSHAILVNSGNANACTGEQGDKDARAMRSLAADALGCHDEAVYVCSTGRIGEPLPMDRIQRGIAEAGGQLGFAEESGWAAADAILTSDTRRKVVSVRIPTEQGDIHLAGMAKGAGMIEPNMATMLGFIVTDARITAGYLQKCLRQAVRTSFNAITVDGDQSTNDTVLVLANGVSGVVVRDNEDAAAVAFQAGLTAVCDVLARQIVGDGEKITKVVEILIHGARTDREAERAARAVGNSLLVKSSWYGNDPNWGRLVDAVGYADVVIGHDRFSVGYEPATGGGVVPAYVSGRVETDRKPEWKAIVKERQFRIHIHLGTGSGSYRLLATDLTEGYVKFNMSE